MGTNARQIVFLEVQDTKGKRRNGYFDGVFLDPWGAPYQITFDTNFSSHITTAGTNGDILVRKNVAVWTDPSKQKWNLTKDPKQRYIESW